MYFWGGIYSQWYESTFEEGGIKYLSAEQYMMAHKAKAFGQEEVYEKVMSSNNPQAAKELGQSITNFSDNVWDSVKTKIVTQGNYLKFLQNEDLLKTLTAHKHLTLVEASPTDTVWGIGLHYDQKEVLDEALWQGKNLLGICIMRARGKILQQLKGEKLCQKQ